MKNIDTALAQVGGYKRWNMAMYFVLGMSFHIPLCWHCLNVVFIGWEPPHSCIESKSWSADKLNNITYLDTSIYLRPNISERNESPKSADRRCMLERYDIETNNVTFENCDEWIYASEGYYTVVEQWNLVCDRNYMTELSQTLYQIGSLVGELFSFVVDKYGRKKIHIITHFIICFIGVANTFSSSYTMFALTRAAIGLFTAINLTAGVMLLLEFFDSKHRTLPGILLQCLWTVSYVLLPGLAYFIKNWTHLQLAISLISPVFAILIIIIPESPSWLISKGETNKAEKILQNIARWNNIVLDRNEPLLTDESKSPENINGKFNFSISENTSVDLKGIKSEDNLIVDVSSHVTYSKVNPVVVSMKSHSKFRHLLDPVILKYLAISSSLWFTSCLVFYGLIFATPSLKGNRFVNFILLGLVEWPATLLACYFSNKFGRRLTSAVSLFIAGCFVAVVIFIPSNTDSMIWLNLTLVIVSKGFVSATFAVMILYTKELFPTNLRATCCGVCQIFGRVGALIAPMATYLIKTDLFWVPYILFGLVSVIVSFLLLFLPETNNQPLPETLEDCHKLNSNTGFTCRTRR